MGKNNLLNYWSFNLVCNFLFSSKKKFHISLFFPSKFKTKILVRKISFSETTRHSNTPWQFSCFDFSGQWNSYRAGGTPEKQHILGTGVWFCRQFPETYDVRPSRPWQTDLDSSRGITGSTEPDGQIFTIKVQYLNILHAVVISTDLYFAQ